MFLGTLLLIGFVVWLGRTIPASYYGKPNAELIVEHQLARRIACFLFFVGVIGAVVLMIFGNEKNGVALAFLGWGFAGAMPLLTLLGVSRLLGKNPREAIHAYAVCEGLPVWFILIFLVAGAALFPFGLYLLIT